MKQAALNVTVTSPQSSSCLTLKIDEDWSSVHSATKIYTSCCPITRERKERNEKHKI